MPKFELNRKTWQLELAKPEKPSAINLLQDVKRVHRGVIMEQQLTDEELAQMINLVIEGGRDLRFLRFKDRPINPWLDEIIYYTIRQCR